MTDARMYEYAQALYDACDGEGELREQHADIRNEYLYMAEAAVTLADLDQVDLVAELWTMEQFIEGYQEMVLRLLAALTEVPGASDLISAFLVSEAARLEEGE